MIHERQSLRADQVEIAVKLRFPNEMGLAAGHFEFCVEQLETAMTHAGGSIK